jgi:CyaY protein
MHSWYPQYWPGGQVIMETDYRKRVQDTYDKIERAFENVDPDIAECESIMGAMTITFADRTRCILSAQPSVQQLWVALAAKGTAFHFNFDSKTEKWMDDKGKNIELIAMLETYFKEATGIEIKIKN